MQDIDCNNRYRTQWQCFGHIFALMAAVSMFLLFQRRLLFSNKLTTQINYKSLKYKALCYPISIEQFCEMLFDSKSNKQYFWQ
jgi:hypothetical protein